MKIGALDIEKLYVGGGEALAAYLGSVLVYEKEQPQPTGQPNDEIWYVSTSGDVISVSTAAASGLNPTLGNTVISNTYSDGKGVIKCSNPITCLPSVLFEHGGISLKLSSITLPDSVTLVEDTVSDSIWIHEITLGTGVTEIGDYAFINCDSLEAINYRGTIAQWNGITKGVDWNLSVPASAVHCSDGDVPL